MRLSPPGCDTLLQKSFLPSPLNLFFFFLFVSFPAVTLIKRVRDRGVRNEVRKRLKICAEVGGGGCLPVKVVPRRVTAEILRWGAWFGAVTGSLSGGFC